VPRDDPIETLALARVPTADIHLGRTADRYRSDRFNVLAES
jgi:hypothetical protein